MQSRCCRGKGIAFVFVRFKKIRITHHKTFKAVIGRGKSSTGWFYGCVVLYLVVIPRNREEPEFSLSSMRNFYHCRQSPMGHGCIGVNANSTPLR